MPKKINFPGPSPKDLIKENSNHKNPACPYCQSANVLPFEDDEPIQPPTVLIILISAFLILGFYFLFVILSTMYYPIMVIIVVTLASFYLHRKEREKKSKAQIREKEFICLDCSQSFKQQILKN